MAEYTATDVQVVQPGASIIFTDSPVPCSRGFIKHRDGTGSFLLSGYVPNRYSCGCCSRNKDAQYFIDFGCNVALNTGATVEPISVSFSLDGSTISSSTMISTPAAVGDFNNISRAINVDVWRGCCETLMVTNTSTQPIQVSNADINLSRPDLEVTR